MYPPYWPTRSYASKALLDHFKILHGQVRSRYSLNSYTNKWHDFTQFKTNPYFQTVFAQQLTESVEAYEFKLQSLDQIDNLIFGTTPHLRTFVDLMGPMRLTQSACKAIELRVRVPFQDPETTRTFGYPLSSNDSMNNIVHVLDLCGITCAQLCEALEECAEMVLCHWRVCAKQLRENMLELEHYTDGIWTLSGRPTIHIVLSDTPSSHIERTFFQLHAGAFCR